jgi:hypothetical protein
MAGNDLLLPPATRLLHIGPHKTGTTTLQGAFWLARPWLGKHGVTYLGTGRRQPVRTVAAALKRVPLAAQQAPYQADWEGLVAAAVAAGDRRVVVSSERFCNADEKVAEQIVRELGGPRAHVVVTLRPLARIVPSQWQQYVQDGLCVPYHEWLDGMFRRPPYEKPTPSFWRRHRHDQLVQRWAAAVGPENLTVIVVDQSDPRLILRTFESMTGLPDGSLTPKDDVLNRSLTLGEAELVRFLNAEFQSLGWSDAAYDRFVRRGAVRQMKTGHRPSPEEPRLITPKWALDRAAEIGAGAAATISALGVRIVGDISSLAMMPPDPADEWTDAPVLPLTAAAQAILGTVSAGARPEAGAKRLAVEGRPLRDVRTRELVSTVLDRSRARLRGRLRATRRSLRRLVGGGDR